MIYTLRKYQKEASDAMIAGFAKEKAPFAVIAATAAGKSLMIADAVHRMNEPTLVLQPSREILLQNYEKMIAYGIKDVGMYSASVNKKEIKTITLATIQSIYKRPELFKHFTRCIIDEVHGVAPKAVNGMYMKFFRATGINKVCGLTATGYRLENVYDFENGEYSGGIKMLNRITRKPFIKKFVYKIEMQDLIDQGYLLKPNYLANEVDLSTLKVNTTGANYDEESLSRWADEHIGKLAESAKAIDEKHQRVLVFCATIKQSEKALEILSSVGVHAEMLTGTTPKKAREDLLNRFQDGRLKWVVNVGTMTTGFDCPPLDAIILFRPTMSVALYVQMVGRGVRLDPNNPNKEAWVYDYTGTVEKFGEVQTIRVMKEDGFKDCLYSEVGRLDNVILFNFEIKKAKGKINKARVKHEKPFVSKYNNVLEKV